MVYKKLPKTDIVPFIWEMFWKKYAALWIREKVGRQKIADLILF